jgi:hypothetical protein
VHEPSLPSSAGRISDCTFTSESIVRTFRSSPSLHKKALVRIRNNLSAEGLLGPAHDDIDNTLLLAYHFIPRDVDLIIQYLLLRYCKLFLRARLYNSFSVSDKLAIAEASRTEHDTDDLYKTSARDWSQFTETAIAMDVGHRQTG